MERMAIVTGASSGIGKALARELYGRGWRVGLVARREAELAEVAGLLGEGAAWAAADVTDAEALGAAIGQLEQTLGPCELVIANAGIGGPTPAARLDPAAVARVLRVNVEGVVNTLGAVLPGMLSRGRGHLAAVSSLAGFRGLPGFGAYSASKAAVTTFLEALRVELRPRGITVSAIHPGFVDTPLTKDARHPMPFLLTAPEAARRIADGLERKKSTINLPWQMAASMWLVRRLPNAIYDRLVRASARREPS